MKEMRCMLFLLSEPDERAWRDARRELAGEVGNPSIEVAHLVDAPHLLSPLVVQ
jgi:hypothetical protein